jgi:hypothetical protein
MSDFIITANRAAVQDIMPNISEVYFDGLEVRREGGGFEVRVILHLSVEQTQQLLAMLGEQRYVRCTLSEAI